MTLSNQAKNLVTNLSNGNVLMGDIRKHAGAIKKDHELAMELWSAGQYFPRLLATLIFDNKLITEDVVDQLLSDMMQHDSQERNQIADWFMANQLIKNKNLAALMTTWEKAENPIKRRLFWYHQARLRWTGKTPPGNTDALMESLEKNMATEDPDVQWTMNFCAGWIGIHEPKYRSRCIELGEKLGLYKDERVPKNCTPSYLPEFIRIEVAKRA
ncbi:MAG: DNA alkylation repair protein [Fimbriimonadales bacterium]|nr:DNA alkylation repair protein [Fimbriimonadales bacterium]